MQLLFSFFLLVALSACGSPPPDTSAGNPKSGRPVILNLRMAPESTDKLKTLNAVSSPIALIEVEVTGDGIILASVKVPVIPKELVTIKLDILPGLNRTFIIIIRDEEGEIVLEGQTTLDIKDSGGDLPQSITIELKSVRAPVISPPSPIRLSALNSAGLPATNPAIQAFLSDATALDAIGNPISEITNDAPLTFPIGETTVTFSATDTAGHSGSATSTVIVANQSIPVITLLGAASVEVAIGATYVDAGATALDDLDGNITANIVTVNSVNTDLSGIYLVTYNVSDAAGNAAFQVTRTVTVSDQDIPVITLLGPTSLELAIGATYVDPGATAFDNVEGNITAKIVTVNSVNTSLAGVYFVTYDVSDAAGNAALQVTRRVTVSDQSIPVITLLGAASLEVAIGAIYVDAGATALDNVDGNITANILTVNPVNTSIPDSYLVTYNVSDAAGNAAVQGFRTVVVLESIPVVTPPTGITVNATSAAGISNSNIAIQVFLSGATATDSFDGPITTITNNAPSIFPVGITTVTFSATNSFQNTGIARSTVTVNIFDIILPVVTAPADIRIPAEGADGTPRSRAEIQTFLSGATAIDNVDGPLPVTNNAPAVFPIGVTTVTFKATDSLGNTGTATATVTVTVTPFLPGGKLSAGSATCSVLSNGSIKCWGGNFSGELGNGATVNFTTTPVLVRGITNATGISAGGDSDGGSHTCASLSNGRIKCWGSNFSGQLGNGTRTNFSVPIFVSEIVNASTVSAGWSHSCALLENGRVKCWGVNFSGELGNGTATNSSVPVFVSGITNTRAISAAIFHSCALLSDGRIKCWGGNFRGQIGNGTTTNSSVPVFVSGITNATVISVGGFHSCALLSDGRINCWGDNISGALGNGTTTNSSVPVFVSGITNATAISAGDGHSCALLSDGRLKCWGSNSSGRLGNGTTRNSSVPVFVSGITNATAVSTEFHSCALLTDGRVKCWGGNFNGSLGNGTTTSSSLPVTVIGLP